MIYDKFVYDLSNWYEILISKANKILSLTLKNKLNMLRYLFYKDIQGLDDIFSQKNKYLKWVILILLIDFTDSI